MPYHIIAIGTRHEANLIDMIHTYEKRLAQFGGVQWLLLPYAAQMDETARRVESAAMAERIKSDDYVILLDERGTVLTSPALAAQLDAIRGSSKRIVFVIGGAYGVDASTHQRADLIWSFSSLVFPHQIMRLLLVEQLYRAHMILENHPYHH